MTPNELVDKFKMDRFSLSNIELDELFELISKNHELVRDIKDSWLMDEYISRVLASDRQNFSAQALKRISELNPTNKQVLTMDQIVKASKDIKLSSSGRYRHKVSERQPSAISSKRPSAKSSKRSATVSGRRNFSKKSKSSSVFLLLVALLLLAVGAFALLKKNSLANINPDSPVEFSQNLTTDLPKIIASENAFIFNGESSNGSKYLGLSIQEGVELKVKKGGSLVLEYSDRTRVVLKEESSLKVSSSKRKELYLESGRISCEASKQKVPFKINTSNSKIEVLGTVFEIGMQKDISNFKNDTTNVMVIEGKVEVENIISKEKIIVSQGQHTVVNMEKKLVVFDNKTKSIQYDFSDSNLPNGLELVELKNAKLLNGNLVVTNGFAAYKIKNANWKFPLKVSYLTKYVPRTSETTIVLMSGLLWNDTSYGILSRNIPFKLESAIWVKFDTYITEDNFFYCICSANIDDRVEKVSSRFAYLEKGNKTDSLILLLKGYFDGEVLFDNIEINEINNSEVPDIDESKNLYKSLPRSKDLKMATFDKFPVIFNNLKEYRTVNVQYGPNALE
jgi:CHASE3 domain sensor protein